MKFYFITIHLTSRIETSNCEILHTPKKLYNWLNSLYQDNIIGIISISQLKKIISIESISKIQESHDIVLNNNNQNNYKIIMTGINELKDLNSNNTEYYKRININPRYLDQLLQKII